MSTLVAHQAFLASPGEASFTSGGYEGNSFGGSLLPYLKSFVVHDVYTAMLPRRRWDEGLKGKMHS